MNEIMWILACLFISVGIVQCIIWAAQLWRYPRNSCHGYYVIPVYDKPELLEEHLRSEIKYIQWNRRRDDIVLLVDMGLREESRQICSLLLRELPYLYCCPAGNLDSVLRELDTLQGRRF